MREVRGWVSGMMVSRLGLVFRLCPSSCHVQTYSHTTLYKELVRGVASHPIHVSCGSAPAQIIPIVDEIWFCPYTALSEMFSYTVNRTVKKSLTCISHMRIFFISHVYWTHPLNTDMLVLYIRYNVCGVYYMCSKNSSCTIWSCTRVEQEWRSLAPGYSNSSEQYHIVDH